MLGGLWGTAGSLRAQPEKPPCGQVPQCARLLEQADVLYRGGKFEEALPLYRDIYYKYGQQQSLYRLGKILLQLGDPAEAAKHFQLFLDSGVETDPAILGKARSSLAEAEEALRGRQPAPSAPADSLPPPQLERGPLLPQQQPPVPEKQPLYTRWWLWTLVGVAATGLAVATPLLVYRYPPGWSNAPEWRPFP